MRNPSRYAEIYYAAFLHLSDIKLNQHPAMRNINVADFVETQCKNFPQTQVTHMLRIAQRWHTYSHRYFQSKSQILNCFKSSFRLQSEEYANDYCGAEVMPVFSWKPLLMTSAPISFR